MARDGHVAVLEKNHNECYNEHVWDWIRSITPSAVKLMSQKVARAPGKCCGAGCQELWDLQLKKFNATLASRLKKKKKHSRRQSCSTRQPWHHWSAWRRVQKHILPLAVSSTSDLTWGTTQSRSLKPQGCKRRSLRARRWARFSLMMISQGWLFKLTHPHDSWEGFTYGACSQASEGLGFLVWVQLCSERSFLHHRCQDIAAAAAQSLLLCFNG